MILVPVTRQFTAAREEDEVVVAVLLFDDVEPLVDLAAQRLAVEVAAEEDRFHSAPQFSQSFVGRALDVVAGEAAQDRLGLGGAEAERRCRQASPDTP